MVDGLKGPWPMSHRGPEPRRFFNNINEIKPILFPHRNIGSPNLRGGAYNVSAFKGPLLNEALLLQYDNFLGDPLVYTNLEMVPALLLPGTCALAGQNADHMMLQPAPA